MLCRVHGWHWFKAPPLVRRRLEFMALEYASFAFETHQSGGLYTLYLRSLFFCRLVEEHMPEVLALAQHVQSETRQQRQQDEAPQFPHVSSLSQRLWKKHTGRQRLKEWSAFMGI